MRNYARIRKVSSFNFLIKLKKIGLTAIVADAEQETESATLKTVVMRQTWILTPKASYRDSSIAIMGSKNPHHKLTQKQESTGT